MSKKQNGLRWLFYIFLPKLPIFLLALPFVFLMRILRPIIWIRLIGIPEQIGHSLGDTDIYLLERSAGLYPLNTVDIFYPDRPGKHNQQVIKMWKRSIPLFDLVYWIAWVNQEIPGFERHHFVPPHRNRDIHALSNNVPPPLSFNRKEEERGEVLLRAMCIPPGSQIVCFHARDNSFKNAVLPKENWKYHNHRDVDINTYVSAIKELAERGYYCIRMGRIVNQAFAFKHPHVIDYPMSPWKSDFADMYLISRCNFYIGTSCGLDSVAEFFRKPMVILNMNAMSRVHAWSPNFFNIFKKLWLIREKRFLKFSEIINSEVGLFMETERYKEYGLEVIDNTPEEIFDAIIEEEERLRGYWQTNAEYEDLQRRFWALYQPSELNQVFRARVGSKFLLHNRELL